jgi:ABC-type long-subunit fatty acid transport system fused permease/ATPase subunit
MALVWPLYGFHIYCFHTALKTRHDKVTNLDLSLFIGFDAITLEVLVNIFTLYFFYTYIFYYIAGDLNHLSTIVIFIPYILCGYITVRLLHKIERAHHKVILGLAGFLWGWFVIFIL